MPERKIHYHSKVTAKGQITLPAELRERLSIEPGDVVDVWAGESNQDLVIEVRKQPSLIEATAGIARPKVPYHAPDWDEVENIIKEEVAQKVYREMNE